MKKPVLKPTKVKMFDKLPHERFSIELSNDLQDALALRILDEGSLAIFFVFDEGNRDILCPHRTILPLAGR